MSLKPCADCGVPSPSTRCAEHTRERVRAKTSERTRKTNGARWQAMSRRLRRMSPFCELCGSTAHLQVDHIVPWSEAPELEFVRENCRILCRSCNSARGDRVTDAERAGVLALIESNRARRVALTWGDGVARTSLRSPGKAEFPSEITGVS